MTARRRSGHKPSRRERHRFGTGPAASFGRVRLEIERRARAAASESPGVTWPDARDRSGVGSPPGEGRPPLPGGDRKHRKCPLDFPSAVRRWLLHPGAFVHQRLCLQPKDPDAAQDRLGASPPAYSQTATAAHIASRASCSYGARSWPWTMPSAASSARSRSPEGGGENRSSYGPSRV